MRTLSIIAASAVVLAAAAAEPARQADSFVDSIGVNTHLPYDDGIYGTGYDAIIKPRLLELGIRHLRDGGYQYPWYWNHLKDLATSGIRSTIIFHGNPPSEVVNTVKSLAGAIEAIEGPNEIDIFPFDYAGLPGADMGGVGITYMRDIYQAVKSDPATSSLPVLGVSLAWTKNAEQFPPKGNIEQWCDLGNLHNYPNLGAGPEDGMYWWFYHYNRVIYPTKPFWVTEMGYSTWPADKDSQFVISERAHGRYLPRLLLTQFNNNVQRSFAYELIDQGTSDYDQEHFGLLRHDGSLKPAAEAIKNLITLLGDRGPAFTPTSLDYSLTSAMSTQNDYEEDTVEIHRTLLQKRDGRYYLVLWQEGGNNSFNSEVKTDNVAIDVAARLQLGASVRSVKVYRPLTDGTTVVASYTNVSAIDLAVPDHPLVIEIGAPGSTPGPGPIIGTGTGLAATYFDNIDLTGATVARTDTVVDFNWGAGAPTPAIAADTFSARWAGQVQAQFSEFYTFSTLSDDGVRLWVNGQSVLTNWTNHGPTEDTGTIALIAGQKYDLTMEYFESGGGAVAALSWASPSTSKRIIPTSQLYPAAVAPQPLPWPALDIGSATIPSKASFANDVWTLTSSGADIGSTSDAFLAVHQPLIGDGEIVARVISQTNSDPWAKAGVMLRDGVGAGAKHATMALTSENGASFQRRRSTSGLSGSTAGSQVGAPYWVKVTRLGSTFRGYESADGVTWRLVGSTTITMPATIKACLIVTSHDGAEQSTAVFDRVAITRAGGG